MASVIPFQPQKFREADRARIGDLALALTPGTRLGAFEITAQIGGGGMGQVYRATDSRLSTGQRC